MRLPWRKIFGVVGTVLPLVSGPVGVIYAAVTTAVLSVEQMVKNKSGATKKQKGMALAGTLLTIGADSLSQKLAQDPRVAESMGRMMDLRVAANNILEELETEKEELAGVITNIQAQHD